MSRVSIQRMKFWGELALENDRFDLRLGSVESTSLLQQYQAQVVAQIAANRMAPRG
jgi:hypothetical protein